MKFNPCVARSLTNIQQSCRKPMHETRSEHFLLLQGISNTLELDKVDLLHQNKNKKNYINNTIFLLLYLPKIFANPTIIQIYLEFSLWNTLKRFNKIYSKTFASNSEFCRLCEVWTRCVRFLTDFDKSRCDN